MEKKKEYDIGGFLLVIQGILIMLLVALSRNALIPYNMSEPEILFSYGMLLSVSGTMISGPIRETKILKERIEDLESKMEE